MSGFSSHELSGGLPLMVREHPGPSILAARLVIRGGSGADPEGQRGAHQLLAGLMTRGCGDLSAEALADLVEGAGAGLRAEAMEDAIVLGLKCAAADAESLLPLLITMVRQPHLAADQLQLERRLNLQTLQRQKEDPFQVAHDQLRHLLYGEGPYGHDPLGIEAEVAGLEQGQLQPLVQGLGAGGSVLVLCGQPPQRTVELLEQALAAAPWSTFAPTAPAAGEIAVADQDQRHGSEEQDTEQLVLMLGARTVPLGHPDSVALRVLQAHLGMGMSSRLFVVMREERGLAYDVGVHLPARCGASPFVMHLSTSIDRSAEACGALLEEWQRCLDEPLAPEALALALAKYQGQDAMGRQTCSQIAERQALVYSHALPADHVERSLAAAAALTPADLQTAARRWLGQPALSLVGPAEALTAAERAWRSHPLSC